jgi:hypothetical protein
MTHALGHILDLGEDFTTYVVLALGLEAPLVTSDTKMQQARRLGVHVQIIPAS